MAMFLFGRGDGGLPSLRSIFSPRSRPAPVVDGDNRVAPRAARVDPQAPDAVLAVGDNRPLPVDEKSLFGDAQPQWFRVLEDDAVYRATENTTFFRLLKILADSDPRDIELASSGVRTFRQLYDQPDDYRGEIVTVAGIVRKIKPQTNPPQNTEGIRKFYEVWIEPDGSRLPIVAVCLELPADYPTQGDVDVRISGYFYKRLGYASAQQGERNELDGSRSDVFRSAPLLLARTLTWKLRPSLAAQIAADDEADAGTGPPLPFGIPRRYAYHVLGLGMLLMVGVSVWSWRLMRAPILNRGPIVGRARREAERAAEVANLNSLKIEP